MKTPIVVDHGTTELESETTQGCGRRRGATTSAAADILRERREHTLLYEDANRSRSWNDRTRIGNYSGLRQAPRRDHERCGAHITCPSPFVRRSHAPWRGCP